MTPISSLNAAAQPLRAVDGTDKAPAVRRPGEEDQIRPAEPRRDEYIPERTDKDKRTERCTGDTGKVDREIEKLKRKRAELEQRLNTERDEARREDLERQLAQVEAELRQKDNDGYRRRNTVFSFS